MSQIHELIPKVMNEIGAVGKTRKNPQQGYAFRGIDDLYNAIQPAMYKYGLFVAPTVTERSHESREYQDRDGKPRVMNYVRLLMKFTFFAPDGTSIEAVTAGEAMDTSDKATNKAMSAAMKYAFLQVFCIPTEESKDPEGDSPELPPQKGGAEPEGKPDPLADPAWFKSMADGAFKKRGFDVEQVDQVYSHVRKQKKLNSLRDMSIEDREKFIAEIVEGKFDKFKKPIVAGAAA